MYQANIHPVTTSSSTKTMAITIANIALCPRRVLERSTACAPADALEKGDRGQDCVENHSPRGAMQPYSIAQTPSIAQSWLQRIQVILHSCSSPAIGLKQYHLACSSAQLDAASKAPRRDRRSDCNRLDNASFVPRLISCLHAPLISSIANIAVSCPLFSLPRLRLTMADYRTEWHGGLCAHCCGGNCDKCVRFA